MGGCSQIVRRGYRKMALQLAHWMIESRRRYPNAPEGIWLMKRWYLTWKWRNKRLTQKMTTRTTTPWGPLRRISRIQIQKWRHYHCQSTNLKKNLPLMMNR